MLDGSQFMVITSSLVGLILPVFVVFENIYLVKFEVCFWGIKYALNTELMTVYN